MEIPAPANRGGLLARAVRRLCLLPHFRGKSRVEAVLMAAVSMPSGRVELPDGFVMMLDSGVANDRDLYFRGCEPETYRFVRSFLRPGMSFVDCGANVGFYTLLAARLVGTSGSVASFEPTPSTFEQLTRNIALNRYPQIRPFALALSEAPGRADLWELRQENHGMNAIVRRGGEGRLLGSCEVSTLDAALAAAAVARPDLIKIDVEGSELALLRGASRTLAADPAPTLIVELSRWTMNAAGYDPEDVVRYLLGLAPYEIYWPWRGRLNRVDPKAPLPHYRVLGDTHGANYVFKPRAGDGGVRSARGASQ